MAELFMRADGKKYRFTQLCDVEVTAINGQDLDNETSKYLGGKSGSFTCDFRFTYKQVCQIAGITNNWLKYHGFPKYRSRR